MTVAYIMVTYTRHIPVILHQQIEVLLFSIILYLISMHRIDVASYCAYDKTEQNTWK
jgi:hypothetical protein